MSVVTEDGIREGLVVKGAGIKFCSNRTDDKLRNGFIRSDVVNSDLPILIKVKVCKP